MAKINFTKGEKFYTAEFQINGPTAIHIERNKVGPLYLKQKSVENGQYDFVKDFGYNRGGDLTIDTAIQGVVYPMWIKIESASEPTLAEMVEGEQSGGGAGTESTMEYLDVSEIDINDNPQFTNIVTTASLVYVSDYTVFGQTFNGVITYGQFGFFGGDSQYIKALAIDPNADILNMQTMSGYVTIKEYFRTLNIEELYNSIPRITKEQFYNLEA